MSLNDLHLYELTDQLKKLADMADDGDLPPEVIRDTLEGLEGDWDAKAVNVAQYLLNLEASAKVIKEAADKQYNRAERSVNRAKQLRNYLLFQFQAMGKTKLDSEFFTLAVRNNPPACGVDDIRLVPDQFLKAAKVAPDQEIGQVLQLIGTPPIGWRLLDADGNTIRRGTIVYQDAEVDKTAVTAEFKAGRDVPGCHPEQGQRLEIKL